MQIMISEEQIEAGVHQLGQQISEQYNGKSLTVLGILTGSIILLADLIRQLKMPVNVGLIQASSYRGTATEPGNLVVNFQTLPPIQGRDVLLIDDIFDTGKTLQAISRRVNQLEAASLKSAVLLKKQGRSLVDFEPDYFVFEIPDCFVVGYGLDYDNRYRQLPYVARLEQHELIPADD